PSRGETEGPGRPGPFVERHLLARDHAAVLAGVVGLAAPERLDGELVPAQRDVLGVGPGVLVAVLRRRGVALAVLDGDALVALGGGDVVMMYVAFGSYLKWAEARIASIAIGSSTRFSERPRVTMSDGTGVGSVQTPLSWFLGLVTKPEPPTQLVEPGRTPLQ